MAKRTERIGVYPGTFDPVTNGHMDIIERAARVVDRLVVAPAISDGKGPLFSIEERVKMLEEEIAHLKDPSLAERITVQPFQNLLMKFVASIGANIVVRGLRAVSDFEYEFQMSSLNAHMNPAIETIFLMASDKHQFISSRFIREIGKFEGDVGAFVSRRVEKRLKKLFAKQKAAEAP